MTAKEMSLIPLLSEKAYELSQKLNLYVFKVPKSANRLSVAQAVKAQFNVDVVKVNILLNKGKTKRTNSKRVRPIKGRESDIKKAYVTLKKGDSIPIYQAEDEKDKNAKKKKEEK